jgi:hypothetical protein
MLCDTATTVFSHQLLQQMFSNYTPHHDALSTNSFCVPISHFSIQHCKQNPTVFQDVHFIEFHHNVKPWVMSLSLEQAINKEKWIIMLTTVLDIRICHIMVRTLLLLASWEVNSISPSPKIPCIYHPDNMWYLVQIMKFLIMQFL